VAHFEIFTVERKDSKITLEFSGSLPPEDEWHRLWRNGYNKFDPEIDKVYLLMFEATAKGRKIKECQFKLTFSPKPKEPIFQLTKQDE